MSLRNRRRWLIFIHSPVYSFSKGSLSTHCVPSTFWAITPWSRATKMQLRHGGNLQLDSNWERQVSGKNKMLEDVRNGSFCQEQLDEDSKEETFELRLQRGKGTEEHWRPREHSVVAEIWRRSVTQLDFLSQLQDNMRNRTWLEGLNAY